MQLQPTSLKVWQDRVTYLVPLGPSTFFVIIRSVLTLLRIHLAVSGLLLEILGCVNEMKEGQEYCGQCSFLFSRLTFLAQG